MMVYDLLRYEDPMVNAAFEIYEADGDLQDLKETLQQVLLSRLYGEEEEEEEDSEEEEQEERLFASGVAENVFHGLYVNGVIRGEEKERFIMLLNGGNIVANAALEVFGVDGDAQDFVDTMRRIQ